MNSKKLVFSIFTVLILLMSLLLPAAASQVEETTASTEENGLAEMPMYDLVINNPDGRTVGVCFRGLWHEYPENSLAGIEAAAETGIDFVFADVKKTSDGVLILFADAWANRMLGVDKNIAEMTYAEISEYYLSEGSGGISAEKSEYKVSTLREALESSRENNFFLMLGCEAQLLADVTALLAETRTLTSTVVYCEDSVKNINNALDGCEDRPFIMGAKQGNVIFAIYSYIEKAEDSNFTGVNLKTTNRYGINFYRSLLSLFDGKLRAMANPTDSATCGVREDSVKWWDDLISRGYSVIMTNTPDLFVEYLSDCDTARERLEKLYEKYTKDWSLPEFASTTLNDYFKAYNDAIAESEAIFADASSSLQDINDAAAHLQKAVDDINLNFEALEDGTAGTTVTVPRILLCIAAAAVVIAVQIYFYKKRAK